MKYDRKKTHEILSDAAIYIDDSVAYKINYVPSWEEVQAGEPILMESEEDGEPVSIDFNDIDLNKPEVMVYSLVIVRSNLIG